MKKIKKGFLYELELNFFEWLKNNKHLLFRIFSAAVVLVFLTFVPYINLIINKAIALFLIVIFTLTIFRASVKNIVRFSILLIIFAIPLVFVKKYSEAESLVNFVYGLMFLTTIKLLVSSCAD